jgi:hypothetical protein
MTNPAPAIPPLVEGDRVRFADGGKPGFNTWRGYVQTITSKRVVVNWDTPIHGHWITSGPLAWFVRATD